MYTYGADRKRQSDPQIEAMFAKEGAAQGRANRKPDADEIVERCLLRLANEGAQILDEGIALRASDIDTIYLNGYGFPGWRGGPMWQIEEKGLAKVVEKITGYEARHGARWKVAPLLERLAASGGKLADAGVKG
jgi:3-hydroxyacyl-CoA dehydrogenase